MPKKLNDASITTITSLSDTDYMNTVNPSTGEISKITVANVKASVGGGPLVYAANISQSGSGAPTTPAAVNTTGTTITLARTGTGTYTATAGAAVFTANKTFVFLQNVFGSCIIEASVTSTTVIDFATRNSGTFFGQDGLLSGNSFKIEIYP